MHATIRQSISGVPDHTTRLAIDDALAGLSNATRCCTLNTAGLVIKAGGSTLAKTGASDCYLIVNGRLVKIAAATDMPALTGITVAANAFNVVCFFVNLAGTVSAVAGTAATTIGGVVFPDFPQEMALVGFLLITHSSTFTGGTTPLDTATTVYVSPIGSVDPTVLLS